LGQVVEIGQPTAVLGYTGIRKLLVDSDHIHWLPAIRQLANGTPDCAMLEPEEVPCCQSAICDLGERIRVKHQSAQHTLLGFSAPWKLDMVVP
jgi:hypothetical protein